jgi:hypothetical protein
MVVAYRNPQHRDKYQGQYRSVKSKILDFDNEATGVSAIPNSSIKAKPNSIDIGCKS